MQTLMTATFTATYIALWGLVAAQTVTLLTLLHRVVRLKQDLYESLPALAHTERFAPGEPVPEFVVRDLTRGRPLRSSELKGSRSLLFFYRPDPGENRSREWFEASLAGLLHKVDGGLLCLVCDGDEKDCRRLADHLGSETPVLWDEDGELRIRLKVAGLPGALLLDEEARIEMYGQPLLQP